MERIRTSVQVVEVGPEEHGRKLLSFLEARLGRLPTGFFMRLVRSGQVRLDGRRCKPFDRVLAGQKVRIPPVEVAARTDAPPSGDLTIVYEDEHMLVVNKPSGLPVHPGTGRPNSVHGRMRDRTPCPTPVHRLDRDTSGLLLCAKSHVFLRTMHAAWNTVTRAYVCWVEGRWPHPDRHTLDAELDKIHTVRGERVQAGQGKPAVSHVYPLQQKSERSLLLVSLDTGRTHQIRVHLADSGHPIVGDPKYGRGRDLLLHSVFLGWPGRHFFVLPDWPDPFTLTADHEKKIFYLLTETPARKKNI
jgi:23S rRNA pseudouridine955/2504/2580 synthase